MLKKLYYASASILMLAIVYHLGATNAQGQAGSMVAGVGINNVGIGFNGLGDTASGDVSVLSPNGDVYIRHMSSGTVGPLFYVGNFWSGGPTPAAQQTWGQLKAQYRK